MTTFYPCWSTLGRNKPIGCHGVEDFSRLVLSFKFRNQVAEGVTSHKLYSSLNLVKVVVVVLYGTVVWKRLLKYSAVNRTKGMKQMINFLSLLMISTSIFFSFCIDFHCVFLYFDDIKRENLKNEAQLYVYSFTILIYIRY